MEPSKQNTQQQPQNTANIKRNKNKKKQKKKGQVTQYQKSQEQTSEQKISEIKSQSLSQDEKNTSSFYGSKGNTNSYRGNSARSKHSGQNSYNSGSQKSNSPRQNRERRSSAGKTLAKEIKDSLTSIVGQIVDLQEINDPLLDNSDSKTSDNKKADKDIIPQKINKQKSHNSNQWSDKQLNENDKKDKKKFKHNNDYYQQQQYYNNPNSGYDNYYNHQRQVSNSYHNKNGGSFSQQQQYNQYNKQNQGQAYYDYSYDDYGRQDQYNDGNIGRREVYYDDEYSRYHHPQQNGYNNNQAQQNQYQGSKGGPNNYQNNYQKKERHDSRYEERKSQHNNQQEKIEDPSLPKIQYISGKPIFMVDWESNSMESYQSADSEDESSDKALNNQVHFDEYGNQIQMFSNQDPIVMMQSQRNGFLEQYIYSQEELEEMKMQQQQKEMSMKPWERDLQEMERYFLKMQEDENLKLNSTIDSQKIIGNMALIQQLKDTQSKEIMAQYFNYQFDEELYKAYINKQIQKFFDQSRITQVIQNQQESKDTKHDTGNHKKQVILNYLQYQEQQSQRDYYKQVREDLHQQQNIMQQQIQVQLQQQQNSIQMQQQMQQMTMQNQTQNPLFIQQTESKLLLSQDQQQQQMQPAIPPDQQQNLSPSQAMEHQQQQQYFHLNADEQNMPQTSEQDAQVQQAYIQPPSWENEINKGHHASSDRQSQLQHMQNLLNFQDAAPLQNQQTLIPQDILSHQDDYKSQEKNIDHMGKAALTAKPFIPNFK